MRPEFDWSKCVDTEDGYLLCFTKTGQLMKVGVTPITFAEAKEEDLQKLTRVILEGAK